MSLQTIDTHKMVEDLRAAGVNKKQAEAHVSTLLQFVELNLATKTDIGNIQQDIANVQHDIEKLRSDLTIKMLYLGGGLFLATTGIILGVLPLLLTQ